MQVSDEVNMKDVLQLVLKKYGLEEKYVSVRIKEAWRALFGNAIANQCDVFYFKNGELTVRIQSAALRYDLSMSKSLLIERINQELGNNFIQIIHLK